MSRSSIRLTRRRRWTPICMARSSIFEKLTITLAVVAVAVSPKSDIVDAFAPHINSVITDRSKGCFGRSCHYRNLRHVPDLHGTQLKMSGLFGEQSSSERSQSKPRQTPSDTSWQVYVDQSKSSLDRGGSATLDAFVCLTTSITDNVEVIPCILPKSALSSLSKSSKGPLVRCISNVPGCPSLDAANVDSVDKVYRLLTRHMRVQGINFKACDCLKWKYKGNGHLEAGKVSLAIDAYNKALATEVTQQEGVVLLLRASAYLQQAVSHKAALQATVEELAETIDDIPALQGVILSQAISRNAKGDGGSPVDDADNAGQKDKSKEKTQRPSSSLTTSLLNRVLQEGKRQGAQFRKTQFQHGLYQYSLLHAAQDALRATELLPTYSTSWLRAGEILMDLWKIKESTQYYERAIALEPSLEESLAPVLKRLRQRQKLLEQARSNGWPEDTLRLALDVAAR